MNAEAFLIPRTLDDPKLMFIWEMDSALIAIVTVFFGLMTEMVVLGLVAAYFLTKGYNKLKEEGGKGLIVRICYWFLPNFGIGRSVASHIRELVR